MIAFRLPGLALCAAAALLLAAAGACERVEVSSTCERDEDCFRGETCLLKRCQA